MSIKRNWVAVTVVTVFFVLGTALAQDQDRDKLQTRDQDRLQTPDSDQLRTQQQIQDRDIYGSELMTSQERDQYRDRMRTATTAEERERVRAQHHTQMQARAQERGVTLPAQPRTGAGGPPSGAGPHGPASGGAGRR